MNHFTLTSLPSQNVPPRIAKAVDAAQIRQTAITNAVVQVAKGERETKPQERI